MNEKPKPFLFRIAPYFPIAEKLALAALVVGILLELFNATGMPIVQIALVALSVVYFLSAYVPVEDLPESSPEGFSGLFTMVIMPKLLWISAAITGFGVLVYTFHPAHQGYLRALMPGGTVILLCVLWTGYLLVIGSDQVMRLKAPLLRAIPLLVVDAYILWEIFLKP